MEGLTRENIASHLQKYRRLLEKKAGISGPVNSKDWPKLEAVQSQHLQNLRKQVSESQDALPAAAAPVAAVEPAAAQSAPAAALDAIQSRASDADAPTASEPPAPLDMQATPPPVPLTPPSADLPVDHIPGIDTMWQVCPAHGPDPCTHARSHTRTSLAWAVPILVAHIPYTLTHQPSLPMLSQHVPQPAVCTSTPLDSWTAAANIAVTGGEPAGAQAVRRCVQDFSQASTPAPCMPMPTMPLPQPQQLQAPGVCPVHPREPPSVLVPLGPDSEGHTLGVPMPQSILPPFMCVMPQHDGAPTLLPMLPAMYLAACGKNTPDAMGTMPIQNNHMPGMMPAAAHHPAAPMMQMPMHAHPYGMPMQGGMAYPMPMPHGPTMASGAGQPMFPGFAPPMMQMPPMQRDAMAVPSDVPGCPVPWNGVPAWRPPHQHKPATQTLPPLTADQLPVPPCSRSLPHAAQPVAVRSVPHSGGGEAMPRISSVASGPLGSPGGDGSGGIGTAGVASNVQGIANIKLESDTEAPPPPELMEGIDAEFDAVEADAAMDIDGADLGWPGWPDAGSADDLKPELALDGAVSSAAEDPMTDAFADILGSPQKHDAPGAASLE